MSAEGTAQFWSYPLIAVLVLCNAWNPRQGCGTDGAGTGSLFPTNCNNKHPVGKGVLRWSWLSPHLEDTVLTVLGLLDRVFRCE